MSEKQWIVTREYEQDTDDEGREIAPPVPTDYVVTDYHTAFFFKSKYSANDLCDLLNTLHDENEQLKNCLSEDDLTIADLIKRNQELKSVVVQLEEDLDYYKTKAGSCETGLIWTEHDYHQYKKKVAKTLQGYYNTVEYDLDFWEIMELIAKDLRIDLK